MTEGIYEELLTTSVAQKIAWMDRITFFIELGANPLHTQIIFNYIGSKF
jgi:hypothetical protein